MLLRITGTSLPTHRRAPLKGEHTSEILQELGYTKERIELLRKKGVVCSTRFGATNDCKTEGDVMASGDADVGSVRERML